MFKYPLVTKQTGAEGQKVSKVLVQEAADIAREIYLGMVLDRGRRRAGADGLRRGRRRYRGGRRPARPEKILKVPVDPGRRPAAVPGPAAGVRARLHRPSRSPQAEKIMTALAKVFLDKDCSLAEINPLVVTPKGEVLALDAKMTFDDNALFRHPGRRGAARRDRGGPGRAAGRPRRA